MAYTLDDLIGPQFMVRQMQPLFAVYEHAVVDELVAAEILLWYPDAVGVMGTFADPEDWHVGVPDLDGNVQLRIPASEIKKILTEKECEVMYAMQEADNELLRYAR